MTHKHQPAGITPQQLGLQSKFRFECHKRVRCFTACCRGINIILTPYDIIRLKNRLGLSSDEFLAIYTTPQLLEKTDLPGVIGKVGSLLGRAGINIAQWRYGRDYPKGRGVSFINLDGDVPLSILSELEDEAEIERARLVRL